MATCSRPLFVSDSASSASPSRASLRRLHTVAVVSIWEPLPRPPVRAVAWRFSRTKQCSRRSTECLASGASVSRLTRPIRRMLSRYSSLMITLHGNLSRCYKAMSALRPDGASRHFMSAGFGRVVLGVVLVMSISAASYTAPSYAAIKKMLSTLDDPFTRFLEPEKLKSLRSGTQGALTGVGLSISYPMAINGSPSGVAVMTATPGGPAEKAGILPGDIILAIDDRSTEDMDIYDAAERLQGPEGSPVDLSIRSGTNTRHVVLKRQTVTLNPVRSRMCEIPGSKDSSKIGYIKLTTFNQNAAESVKEAIKTLRDNNVKSFVLDLRNNSGGLFPEGIQIAKIWMDKGVIVYICDSQGVRDIYEADGADTIAASEPLVVLVNKGTASASEILAGALKDNKRAVVYGEPTYGKGKIQSVFGLSDGSGLAVTVARYETPAHTDIDKVGVIPDRPLPASFPTDEDGFCSCLRDSTAACNLNAAQLFARS
ncbi:hypothetical protein SORBI_3004G343500 [Sorghum bicolor]|uniref:PDZ domain-containing protein n=1 Tax=Sorghum bicolor TaxID=4558 RepID=A0A1Z5RQI5_SORBI|nr:hypothetical protein SORBI_3004G343500 [Sorghum bicolor]